MQTTLGLDLGPNSIGWTLIEEHTDQAQGRIIDMGARIFPEGADNFDSKKEKSRNEDRRLARQMRNQVRRRARRKRRLRDTLIELGLFPSDPTEQQELYDADPYELRARTLDEELTLHELGRVLLHLNQRRGFCSNRKRDRKDSEVSGMLAEISDLAADIAQSPARTLGEYLHLKSQAMDHAAREVDDHIRGRHTQRQMLKDEFDLIWKSQQTHHPEVLTDELAYGALGKLKDIHKPIARHDTRRKGKNDLESFGVHGLIFFHRTLKPIPKNIIGLCELEPKQKRCHKADRQAQWFCVLSEVNNLRLIDQSTTPPHERPLSDQERALLLDKLKQTKEATFEQIKKWLGKLPDSPPAEQIQFNLEQGKRTRMKGMVTDALLGGSRGMGEAWYQLPESTRDAAVRELIESVDDDLTHETLVQELGLSAEQADQLLGVELAEGYLKYSLKAIENLLPHMERGLPLSMKEETESAIHVAGYMRPDQLQHRVFHCLPDPQRVRDARIGDIPNPVVKRTLVELRKVVNAIVKEYGRPDAIHVEMAREVRQGSKARSETASRMREIVAEREDVKKFLKDNNQRYGSRGINIRKAQLWRQQNHDCLYCNQKISQAQLFTDGQTDIDHILPYSRCLDDSQMNKVVCHRQCNHDKGNQTPYEWLADSDPVRYDRVCQNALSLVRSKKLPFKKFRRLIQKELQLNEFINRQLTDTGYIAKVTAEYLKCLFTDDENRRGAVLGLKGQLTAELRRQWGLNQLLRDDEQDTKSRDDHRHHAVDALVIALTNHSRLQRLSNIHKQGGVLTTGEALDFPWDTFRDDAIQCLEQINVSHRAERKVAGALHKETFYGPTQETGVYVVRKKVEDLSPNEVPSIRDDAIRKIVEQRLAEHGIEVGRGKKKDNKKFKQALADVHNPLAMPSGVPVKKVRLLVNDQTIQPIREGTDNQAYVSPGSTHHLCLFEWKDKKGKTKRGSVFVNMLEATNRLKKQKQELTRRQTQWQEKGLSQDKIKYRTAQTMREIAAAHPLIQRTPPRDHDKIPPDADFMFSLSRGEMVLADVKGEEELLVYNTAASTSGQMWFYANCDARKQSDRKKLSFTPNTLQARKVTVDLLGRVRWAND